jgi:hemerythrin
MEAIEWNKAYSVGVEELDEQHKRLFKMINTLFEAPAAGISPQGISDLLTEMAEYASVHFETEEGYMSECAYPEIDYHIRAHQRYREKVDDLRARAANEKSKLSSDMLRFLYDWLAEHILSCDKKYTPFVRKDRSRGQLSSSASTPPRQV